MRPIAVALIVFALAVPVASGHFIWIVPAKDGGAAHVYFSDQPEADSAKLLDKITQTEVFLRGVDGVESALKAARGKQSFEILPGTDAGILLGTCHYGVLAKGDADPFLLMYYAKAVLPKADSAAQSAPSKRLPLDIVRVPADTKQLQVLWQGKPLAGAEVVVSPPGDELPKTVKSDPAGMISVGALRSGTYGIRARHIEDRAGSDNGKTFKLVKHYTTLVFDVAK